ncbi:MAG: hypothetical protein EXS55_02075 [Candidatus Magasanikbacteria bacterium]|nr:hypothetical protein [Candidatus Magasanikbacteria bacterium]
MAKNLDRIQSRGRYSDQEFEKVDRRFDYKKLLESLGEDDRVLVSILFFCAKRDATIEQFIAGIPNTTPKEIKAKYLKVLSNYKQFRGLPADYDELRAFLHEDKPYVSMEKLGITQPLSAGGDA